MPAWYEVAPHPSSVDGPRVPETPEHLPEVHALVDDGWELAPEPPFWVFLPALWPPDLRTWVHDRATRYQTGHEQRDGQTTSGTAPWPDSEYDEQARWSDQRHLALGLDAPPSGRLWLLRAPAGGSRVESLWARFPVDDISDPEVLDGPALLPLVVEHLRSRGVDAQVPPPTGG